MALRSSQPVPQISEEKRLLGPLEALRTAHSKHQRLFKQAYPIKRKKTSQMRAETFLAEPRTNARLLSQESYRPNVGQSWNFSKKPPEFDVFQRQRSVKEMILKRPQSVTHQRRATETTVSNIPARRVQKYRNLKNQKATEDLQSQFQRLIAFNLDSKLQKMLARASLPLTPAKSGTKRVQFQVNSQF